MYGLKVPSSRSSSTSRNSILFKLAVIVTFRPFLLKTSTIFCFNFSPCLGVPWYSPDPSSLYSPGLKFSISSSCDNKYSPTKSVDSAPSHAPMQTSKLFSPFFAHRVFLWNRKFFLLSVRIFLCCCVMSTFDCAQSRVLSHSSGVTEA